MKEIEDLPQEWEAERTAIGASWIRTWKATCSIVAICAATAVAAPARRLSHVSVGSGAVIWKTEN